ncbi:nuclear transport factor 2 family protein [Carboxylicivirga sp. N1Y90]|uniref:nuclear transport factor 2 family protein n=1 Tax=Carboxylicivirga fragile TaxID=3417571 RepID=UPI003D32CBF0|nr:nuclear transport factor 2 family protein [Marinilabiliaceae bacterium N1Y90]
MKKIIFMLALISLSTTLIAQSNKDEQAAIKKVIQTAYVEGLQNEGDLSKIDAGIHSDFNLLGIDKDGSSIWKLPIAEWKEKVKKRKEAGAYPKTGDKLVSIKFLSVDVTGTSAVAKFEFYVGKEKKYVDYISLYKFKDGWKMVSKIYYQFPE